MLAILYVVILPGLAHKAGYAWIRSLNAGCSSGLGAVQFQGCRVVHQSERAQTHERPLMWHQQATRALKAQSLITTGSSRALPACLASSSAPDVEPSRTSCMQACSPPAPAAELPSPLRPHCKTIHFGQPINKAASRSHFSDGRISPFRCDHSLRCAQPGH